MGALYSSTVSNNSFLSVQSVEIRYKDVSADLLYAAATSRDVPRMYS